MPARRAAPGVPRWLGPAILSLHLVLLGWIATRNSVTFDENFHVAAGVVALTHADLFSSYAQPPLARALYGAAALAAGARSPDERYEAPGAERDLAWGFERANADRYSRVFFAARIVAALLSTLLAFMTWRAATRWFGAIAGIVALLAYALSPEALAHGAIAGMDVPTAVVFLGAVFAGAAWLRTGRWRAWLACAAWLAAAFAVRFSAVQIPVMLALMAGLFAWLGKLASVPRTLLGLALLPVVAVVAVDIAYLGQGLFQPLSHIQFHSHAFLALAHALPHVRVPLPLSYLLGLDYVGYLAEPGATLTYLLGAVRAGHDPRYLPVALLAKWPLGWTALLLLALAHALFARGSRRAVREITLLVPALVVLLWAGATGLDHGVRYVLPALPFLAIWASGIMTAPRARARRVAPAWALAGALCVGVAALESMGALPYPLAFFNAAVGGPGRGDRIVNDSNVDWGQGLIALRDELRARHIPRVHLAYHGTTDPALYGIDSVPYTGGVPGPESEYLAISSYFLVGLPARMVTHAGFTPKAIQLEMGPLRDREPLARPAGCMYLFRVR